MARIGIDAWAIEPAGKGHARTQLHAVEALARRGGHDLVVFVRTEAAAALLPTEVERVVVGSPVALAWEQVGLPRAVRRHRIELVLTWTERLPIAGGGRYAVWLFELPTHRIAENRRARAGAYQRASDLVTLALWRRSVRRAARVAAGSRATAAELEAALGALPAPVDVVHPGLAEGFSPGPGRAGRYVFHLGSADPRDNTRTVLEAVGLLREPVRLVVGGGLGALAAPLEARARALGLDAEFTGRVTDAELVALYRGAAAYVDATLYEGFGYQVLEAMACGAPVVAADATSIPEVVGDAGLLCDPRSPGALAEALERILADAALAGELRRRGLERAARFTWERTGEALGRVLDEALAAA